MNKNDIPGIYNYCDRWCEKCAFTSRCLTYKFGKIMDENLDAKIKENQNFWEPFDKDFKEAIENLEEELFFEEDEDYEGNDFEIKRLIAESKDSAQLAKEYIDIASNWFNKNEVQLVTNSILEGKKQNKLNDSIDVIHWYHIFIYPKIMRALQGEDEDLLEGELPLDSDGFAKIVLIAIERSITAWGYIYMQIEDKNEFIINIIKLLVTLQQQVEEDFPNAKIFVRPGFDEEN